MLQQIVDKLKLTFKGTFIPGATYKTNDVYIKNGHPYRVDKDGAHENLIGKTEDEIKNAVIYQENGVRYQVRETNPRMQVAEQVVVSSQDGKSLRLLPSAHKRKSKIAFLPHNFDGAMSPNYVQHGLYLPTKEGGVVSSGYNDQYGLGTGNWDTDSVNFSVRDVMLPQGFNRETITQLAGSTHGNCFVVNEEGQVACWGYNNYGCLGLGHQSNIAVPVLITNLPPIKMIIANASAQDSTYAQTFAITKAGDVYCCGEGGSNVFGMDNGEITLTSWTKIPDLKNIVSASTTRSRYNLSTAYFVSADGSLFITGRNDNGEGANGSTYNNVRPHKVEIIENGVKQHIIQSWLSGMYHHNGSTYTAYYKTGMVMTSEGNIYMIGYCSQGIHPVNNGTQTSFIKMPFPVGAGKIVQASMYNIAAPYGMVTALDDLGNVWSWGSNVVGQLGNGTTVNNSTPQKAQTSVAEIGKAVKVQNMTYGYNLSSYGHGSNAILNENGELWVTGWNRNCRLGLGHGSNISTWTKVPFDYRTARIQDFNFYGNPDGSDGKLIILDTNNEVWWSNDYNGYNDNPIVSSSFQKMII